MNSWLRSWRLPADPEIKRLLDEVGRAGTLATRATILKADPSAFFGVELNGVDVWLPQETLRTVIHCVHGSSGGIRVSVEAAHLAWMLARMRDGGTFLDVGASTGATMIPMAARFGGKAVLVAFEPAQNARRLLEGTLTRNDLLGVEIVAQAVSDKVGVVQFAEYGHDETGVTPFLPEVSAIVSPQIDRDRSVEREVPATTLDAFCRGRALPSPIVVKVDVEGFEANVLAGASDLIANQRPWFSIDIHPDPFGPGTTETKVRAALEPCGYTFEVIAHVIVASPPSDARLGPTHSSRVEA